MSVQFFQRFAIVQISRNVKKLKKENQTDLTLKLSIILLWMGGSSFSYIYTNRRKLLPDLMDRMWQDNWHQWGT